MIETPLYETIKNDYPNELIKDWEFIKISPNCRLHFKPIIWEKNEFGGFYFHSVHWTGNSCTRDYDKNDYFTAPEVTAETLLYGIAQFDGIRHLYFGTEESENEGYFYYPDLDIINKIMIELVKLEQKYCNSADKRELK